MGGYAVVDVETTGLLPDWHHRVAEIAVVHVDPTGVVTDEWATLVNPRRDLGPQHVHRIRAADVRHAPTFADLTGDIAARLRGRVLVAHNLAFDSLFLMTEFARAGFELPFGGLCTMRLAREYLKTPSRSLAACCRAAGITQHAAHSALDDTRATAALLAHFLAAAGPTPPWSALIADAGRAWPHRLWPEPPPCGRTADRSTPDAAAPDFLSRIVDQLPSVPHPPAADDYLALLDRALVGRHLSATDQDALVATAATLGLHRADVLRLHQAYFAAVTAAATPTTEADHADLTQVATLLGLDSTRPEPTTPTDLPRFRLHPGDIVTFTGDMQDRRPTLHALATAAGLTVDDRHVTRRTTLLVAADPDTLSAKATTARRYGIPIITEPAFHTLLAHLPQ